jgi:hypothetical protein
MPKNDDRMFKDDLIQYEHHGTKVWVHKELVGLHRSYCLCYSCEEFKGGSASEAGCPIAKQVYGLCVEESLVLPVWECPMFEYAEQADC